MTPPKPEATAPPRTEDILRSEFADDPGFAEILDQFVGNLPARIEAVEEAVGAGDLQTAARLAHQIKGVGGGYGYPALTEAAAALEQAASANDRESVSLTLGALRDVAGAVARGHQPAKKEEARP